MQEGTNNLTGPSRARAIVTLALMLGALVAAMEATVVSTAMPTVIGHLHGIEWYAWVFSAYLLTSTTTVPIYGKLSDIYGRRPIYVFSMALFLAGSMLCGFAQSMPQLIGARVLQGLGAGGLMPVVLTVIGDLYTLEERPRIQALATTVWGLAGLVGPMAGALITMHLSWHWVFFVNVPVGLVSGAIIAFRLKEDLHHEKESIDYLGSLILTAAIVLLLVGAEQLQSTGRLDAFAPMAGSGLFFAMFAWQERRAPHPILPLDLFRDPIILASSGGNLIIGAMMFSANVFMPLLMQGARGQTPAAAGQVLTPLIVAWSITAWLGAKWLIRFGLKATVIVGSALMVAATTILALMPLNAPLWVILLSMAILGFGLGPISVGLLIAAQNAVEWRQRGVVTASVQFFRSVGGALTVSLLGTVLLHHTTDGLAALSRETGIDVTANALLDERIHAALPPQALAGAQAILGDALHTVFVLVALIALLGVANAWVLARRNLPDLSRPPLEPALAVE